MNSKRNILFIIALGLFFITPFYNTQAQNKDIIDPAIKMAELKLESASDKKKLELLEKLINYYDYLDPEKALLFLKSYSKTAQSQKMSDKHLWALGHICDLYIRMPDYEKALDYCQLASSIADSTKNYREKANALNRTGMIYANLNMNNKGLEYYYEALELRQKINDEHGIAASYNNIAIQYSMDKKYDEALNSFNNALKIEASFNDTIAMAGSYNNIGNIHSENGNYQEALRNFTTAQESYIQNNHGSGIVLSTRNIGHIYFRTGDYHTAIKFYKKSLEAANTLNLREGKLGNYSALSNAYKELGKHKQALQYYEQYTTIKDSISNENIYKKIALKEANFSVEQHEKKLEIREKTIEILKEKEHNQRILKRIAFLGIFTTFIIIFLTIRYFRLNRKLLLEETNRVNTEKKLREQENVNLEEKMRRENELGQVHNKRLEERIEYRERELASSSMYISQRNEILEDIRNKLEKIIPNANLKIKNHLREINRILIQNINMQEDWNTFKLHFESVHPDFFVNLKIKFPVLTSNDLKLCAYIKINISNKETARLLNISASGMKTARNRLKKKLLLTAEDDLNKFVSAF